MSAVLFVQASLVEAGWLESSSCGWALLLQQAFTIGPLNKTLPDTVHAACFHRQSTTTTSVSNKHNRWGATNTHCAKLSCGCTRGRNLIRTHLTVQTATQSTQCQTICVRQQPNALSIRQSMSDSNPEHSLRQSASDSNQMCSTSICVRQ